LRYSFTGDGDQYDRVHNKTLTEPGALTQTTITDQFGESGGLVEYILYLDKDKGYIVGYECREDSSAGTYWGKQLIYYHFNCF
jgi:hypothetical protein